MPFGSRIQFYILRECLSGLALVLGILLIAILMSSISISHIVRVMQAR